MATTRKFVARHGLDNNSNSIDNLGVSGASLTRAGAHSLTLTTSGNTTATLPSGTVTLPGIQTTNTFTGYNEFRAGLATSDVTSSLGHSITISPGTSLGADGADWTLRGAYATLSNGEAWELTLPRVNGELFVLPSLTSGSILFSNGTTITQDNANLFWDNTNKRLGVSTGSNVTSKLHVVDTTTGTTHGVIIHKVGTDANSSRLTFRKARGTYASPTAVANGDFIGSFAAGPYSGSSYLDGTARITANVNGTVTTSSVPTDLQFHTGTTTGGTERMRIFSNGNISIGSTTNSNKLYTRASVNAVSGTVTGVYGHTDANGDGATQYAVRARAEVSAANSSLYMKHYGVLAEMIERTSAFNANLTEAYGVYAKVTGSGVNMSKIGIFVDTMNGGSLYPLSTNANYGIIASGGLNIFHSLTEQVRIAYDSSNYINFTVGSSGTATIDGAGTNKGFAFASGFKLGFFGATAIAQPTTAHAAATFTANTGTAVNDASTFDGYTIKQIVKALRDLGILA